MIYGDGIDYFDGMYDNEEHNWDYDIDYSKLKKKNKNFIDELGYKSTNLGDKLSDMFLGTNNEAQINAYNGILSQKYVNENQYKWAIDGMTSAGLNPIMTLQNGFTAASGSDFGASKEGGALLQSLLGLMFALILKI